MTTDYLQIHNIHKNFDQFVALKNINLSIQEGEFICFLGPSGCGKTTLLRIIAGLEQQNNGQVVQAGEDVSLLPPEKRDFGIVFQSYALFPNLTVADNISYGLKSRRKNRKTVRQRVTELLAVVGLSGSEDKYPAQLSGGQQQRVALARALATRPGLLLLDEPLSALDARVRASLREEIKRTQRELGVTTIMVTHDQEEALSMADRVVVMNHGTIEQVGTPEEIYHQPNSQFVADFVGVMNFLPSRLTSSAELEISGKRLSCPSNHSFSANSAVHMAIRPEAIELSDHCCAESLPAQVVDMEFQGNIIRSSLKLEACGSRILADVSLDRQNNLGMQPGRRLGLRLPAQKIHLFAV